MADEKSKTPANPPKADPAKPPADASAGAWAKDELFGMRIDQAFPLADTDPPQSELFAVLAAHVDGTVDTDLGRADHLALLVSNLDSQGLITGRPFKCGTIASAIVEKLMDAQPGDFPAIVKLMRIDGKFGKTLVMQKIGDADPSALLDEFAVPTDTLRAMDALRPKGEGMGGL